MGGTGRTHDWHLTATLRDKIYPRPLILAGGLTPINVQQAIKEVRPFAVDVSSGVEKTIGVKDRNKIRNFIKKAKENID
jgi:phosphoribosylanthranilate isomerase